MDVHADGDAGRRISSEPIINWLHAHAAELAFVAATLTLIGVSVLPLDFSRPASAPLLAPAWVRFWHAPLSKGDVIANIALYGPLGALAYLASRRTGWSAAGGLAMAIGAGLSISLFCEGVQSMLPARTTSVVDVASNTLGAMLGAIGGGLLRPIVRARRDQMRWEIRSQPWSAAAKVVACLIIVIQLRPYDLLMDARDIGRGLRAASLSPLHEWKSLAQAKRLARRPQLSDAEIVRARWDYSLERSADAAMYAIFAAMTARAIRRTRGFGRLDSAIYAISATLILSGLVAVLRIFEPSRGLDTAHIASGLAGGAIGAAIGCWKPGGDSLRLPRGLLIAAAYLICAAIVLRGLAPLQPDIRGHAVRSKAHAVRLIPFASSLASRPNDSLLDLSSKLLPYVALGGLASAALRLRGHTWRGWIARYATLCAAMAATLEAAHLFIAARHCDVTPVFLAFCGVLIGAAGARWVADYWRFCRIRVVEDRLTSELMSGPGFDKRAAIVAPRSSPQAAPAR